MRKLPPEDLPSTLRREHDLKKTSRYSHASNLLQILKESANETKRRTLLQNGISDALVDILLDIYSGRVIPEDELFLHYVEDILGSLAECAILMRPLIGSETSLQYVDVDVFLQKVVRLWNVMWTKRHCMKVKVRRYRSVAAGFIVSFCGLYQKFYKRQPGIEERAAHLLMYCWVFNLNEDLVLGDWIVPYMFLLICSLESHEHMGRFIQEAVVNTLEPTQFVVAVLSQLYYSLNGTLKQLILILGGFTCIAPKLLEDDEMGNLLIGIGRACQRQICKGEEDMVYDVKRHQ
ncbi:hypothetical protein PHLCEN_2v4932 [Hermanssonia centrifuga]|uniref:Uncharacterized protein n=1 Tax=Hermanssonia centrifuga TaxID=98765 RepID=A0A2R6PCC4_9APHY|nr:hypothetical protein PHLCEN_2v4932 [Hermanssonia centrifuga]